MSSATADVSLPPDVADLIATATAVDKAMVKLVARLIERPGRIAADTGVTVEVWLQSQTALPGWECRQLLRAADVLPCMPHTWDGWQDGRLCWATVGQIVKTVAPLGRVARADADRVVGAVLDRHDRVSAASVLDAVTDWNRQRAWAAEQRREDRDLDVLHIQPRLDNSGGEIWGDFSAVGLATILDALDAEVGRGGLAALEASPAYDADALAHNAQQLAAARGAALVRLCSRGSDGTARRPLLVANVSLETLLGLDELPGRLATSIIGGELRVSARTARQLADGGCDLRVVVTDAEGMAVGVGRSSRQPPGWLVDAIVAWHATCTFPSCRRPARNCDLDHAAEWDADSGPTDADNLHPVCRSHHTGKDDGWSVTMTAAGDVTWTHQSGASLTTPATPNLHRLIADISRRRAN